MAKFINLALAGDQPSLANVDHIARIYPGLEGQNGKDRCCTIVFGFSIEYELEQPATRYKELQEYSVEVFMPIKEIIRRIKEEALQL